MSTNRSILLDAESKEILDSQPRSFNFSEFVREQIKLVLGTKCAEA